MEITHVRRTSTDLEHWTDYFIAEHNGKWFDIYKTANLEQPEQSNLQIIEDGCNEDIGHYTREVYNSHGRHCPIPSDEETRAVFNAFIAKYN